MSTAIESKMNNEEKSFQSGKDDQKQQQSMRKKESKVESADVPADAGSSLVGGTLSAVQHAVDAGIHMLPESMQAKAESLQNVAIQQAQNLSKRAQPVIDSYQADGIVAAAKVASGIGAGAAVSMKDAALTKGAALKDATLTKGTSIKDAALTKGTSIKDAALTKGTSIKAAALTKGAELKQKLPLVGGAPAGDAAAAPKPKGRRRRGGRGKGNRKMKLREIAVKEGESIKETLGEKAAELKEVVIEDARAAPGIIGNIRNTAAGYVQSATSTASGIINTATSTASGLVSGATSTASGLVSGATSTASGLLSSAQTQASSLIAGAQDKLSGSSSAAKPELERQDALPVLGTPNDSPNDIKLRSDKPMAVDASSNLESSSGIIANAKFRAGQLVDAIKDKADNMSMNADDDSSDSSSSNNNATLERAKQQLTDMKEKVVAAIAEKTAKSEEKPADKGDKSSKKQSK